MSDYNLERLTFLVVDDNRHMRALVKRILAALGVPGCLEAADGADAFVLLRQVPVDVVVTNWNMAPVDGIAFARQVRSGKDSPNPFVPIIMVSGHTEFAKVAEARDAGVNEFLAKPISAQALYARIRAIIERPRPFVRTASYLGPDRRRHGGDDYAGPERRQRDIVALEGAAGGAETLSADEVASLVKE